MGKTSLILLTAALLAGPVMAAGPFGAANDSGIYLWLHPKLGAVKVDKAMNAMITGERTHAESKRPAPSAQRR